MPIPPSPSEVSSDTAAISDLITAFSHQRRAFARDRSPTLAERQHRIQALMQMLTKYRRRISAALNADFGSHPVPLSDLVEVLGVLGRARYALDHLEEWMGPSPRETDVGMLGTCQAYVQCQPKGVVGNIVPWNFPFDLSLGPLVEMLAAGNRVILKPSEYTPASAVLLREMIADTFDPTLVHVAVGGRELARAFTGVAWDHLLYTGSAAVGRQVMEAAARNLTPVTLELGGKCPALMAPGSVSARNVESVIGTKTIKNGQMCITVDYCLVPRRDVDAFVNLAASFMKEAAPSYSRSSDCAGIISLRHLDRLQGLLAQARERGSRIVTLEVDGQVDRVTRRMPLNLVVDPPLDIRLMQEEIFGPILPIIPYDEISQAVEFINSRDRPLGVYVFSDEPATVDAVLGDTLSGGVAVNTCALQGAIPALGFGGVGASGIGRHHGIEGFREFSNQRGVVKRGTGDLIDVFYVPYSNAAAVAKAALGAD
jgi:coniferyl-aldehyde dehydrogenase